MNEKQKKSQEIASLGRLLVTKGEQMFSIYDTAKSICTLAKESKSIRIHPELERRIKVLRFQIEQIEGADHDA